MKTAKGNPVVCQKCGSGDNLRKVGSRVDCKCGHSWAIMSYWRAQIMSEAEQMLRDKMATLKPGQSVESLKLSDHGFGGRKRGRAPQRSTYTPNTGYGMRFRRWRHKHGVTYGDLTTRFTRAQLVKLAKHEDQRDRLTTRQLMPYMHAVVNIANERKVAA